LPHVGNDIVDLTQSTARRKSSNIRFLDRVFTPEEQSSIRSSLFPNLRLWSCWAAKEAAYKAISKMHPDIPAIPKLFPVVIDSEEGDAAGNFSPQLRRGLFPRLCTGFVLTPGGTCWIRIEYHHTYLHCLAFTDAPDSLNYSRQVHYFFSSPPNVPVPESEAGRLAARFHLARLLAENFEDLEISRRKKGSPSAPPCVLCRGRILDVDLSLSHDGFFIAHACLLQPT